MKTKKHRIWAAIALSAIAIVIAVYVATEPSTARAPRGALSEAPVPKPEEVASDGPKAVTQPVPKVLRQVIQLTDLGGGSASGLAVRIRTGHQNVDAVSDRNGVIAVEMERPGRVRLEMLARDWQMPRDEFEASARPETIHVYRDLRIDGYIRVMDSGPPDLRKVKVGYSVGVAQSAEPADVSRLHTLLGHGLRVSADLTRPNQAGVFEGVMPRLPGFVVHASAPGWHAVGVPVVPDADGARASVVLELRRGIPLRGRLLDDRGNPVSAGTMVQVYVTVRGSLAELTPEQAYRLRGSSGCGMTCRLSVQHDEAIASFRYVARTDGNGEYSLVVEQEGEVNVRSHVAGHAPAAAKSDWPAAQENRLNLVAKRDVAPATAQILVDGTPRSNTRIELVELESRGPQMAVVLQSDANSRIPTSWLVQGRSYLVFVGNPPNHVPNRMFLRWDGRDSINVIPKGKEGHVGLPKGYW